MLLFFVLLLTSCEENLTLDLPEGDAQLVVEGHIEQDAPPIVVLTHSVPVFRSFSDADFEDAFVHGAQVVVTSEGQDYVLQEIASASFTEEQKRLVSEQLGLSKSILKERNFYIYTSDALRGRLGGKYKLRISHEGKVLTSATTIPNLSPLDSLWTVPHPDADEDSLVTLYYRFRDPDTLGNNTRYFTKRNSEPFYPGLLASVFTDEFINGTDYIDYPLDRGEPRGQKDIDMDKYSYFGKGDTITVKWCSIDFEHYRFWFTIESEQNGNGSPIGSPNTTRSNINGGLGIWGGYGVSYHRLIVK